jgi:hypothetical protein
MADHDTADRNTGESVPARWNAQSPDSNMWMSWDNDPRNTGAELEGERATLIDYLRSYRHMVEEYARHAGHADLLRERIDGRVGQ